MCSSWSQSLLAHARGRFEIRYKQRVGAEDVFLGMSDKTPASSDCTHLVVKVHFPGATLAELDLKVTKNRIKAESPKLYVAASRCDSPILLSSAAELVVGIAFAVVCCQLADDLLASARRRRQGRRAVGQDQACAHGDAPDRCRRVVDTLFRGREENRCG